MFKNINTMQYKVSIIVPIYNVEKYIERCAVSLFEQDFDDIEYIFVNDCTPDNSMQILKSVLERYPHRQVHCKFIEHASNKGSGASRKTGLLEATGEYIIQIDADDWVELDMISSMYKEAKSKDLDILICDYYLEHESKSVYISQFLNKRISAEDIFRSILSGDLDGIIWNKLIRQNLYIDNNVFPLENISIAEDKHLMIRLFFFAKQVGFINKAFYHYNRTNSNSITYNTYTDKNIKEIKFFIKDTEKFLNDLNIYTACNKSFHDLIMLYYKIFYHVNDEFLYQNYKNIISVKNVLFNTSSYRRKIKYLIFHLKMKFKYLFNK